MNRIKDKKRKKAKEEQKLKERKKRPKKSQEDNFIICKEEQDLQDEQNPNFKSSNAIARRTEQHDLKHLKGIPYKNLSDDDVDDPDDDIESSKQNYDENMMSEIKNLTELSNDDDEDQSSSEEVQQ